MIHNIQHLRALAALLVVFFHSVDGALSYGYTGGVLSNLKGFGACL